MYTELQLSVLLSMAFLSLLNVLQVRVIDFFSELVRKGETRDSYNLMK